MARLNNRDQYLANIVKGYGKTVKASAAAQKLRNLAASATKLLKLDEGTAPTLDANKDGSVNIVLPVGRYLELFPTAQPNGQAADGSLTFAPQSAGIFEQAIPAVAEQKDKETGKITRAAVAADTEMTEVFVSASFAIPVPAEAEAAPVPAEAAPAS